MSSFGWCEGAEPHELFILGGTDGSMVDRSLYKIDLKQARSWNLCKDYPDKVALSKLVAAQDPKKKTYTLYSFGGIESDGEAFSLDLSEDGTFKDWIPFGKIHLSLLSDPR